MVDEEAFKQACFGVRGTPEIGDSVSKWLLPIIETYEAHRNSQPVVDAELVVAVAKAICAQSAMYKYRNGNSVENYVKAYWIQYQAQAKASIPIAQVPLREELQQAKALNARLVDVIYRINEVRHADNAVGNRFGFVPDRTDKSIDNAVKAAEQQTGGLRVKSNG